MNLCIGGAALLFLLSLYLVFFVAYQTKEEPTFSLKVFFIKVFVPRGVGLILGGLILGLIFLFKPQFEASQEEIGLITFSLRLTLNWAIVSFLGYSLVSILKKNCIYLGYRLEVALLVLRYFTLFLHIVLTAAHWGGIFVLVCAISSAAPFVEEVIQGAAERISELSPSAVVGWPWWKYALVGAGGFVAVGIIIYCCIKYGGGGAEASQSTLVQSVIPEINFSELISKQYEEELSEVWVIIELRLKGARIGNEISVEIAKQVIKGVETIWRELSAQYGAENLAWQQAPLPAVEGSGGVWTLEGFLNWARESVSNL